MEILLTDLIRGALDITPSEAVKALTTKSVPVPPWERLEKEYNVLKHPVFDRAQYPDIATKEGVEKVSRIGLAYPQLATKRMAEMCFATPVTLEWDTDHQDDPRQTEVVKLIEKVLARNFYDALNIKRGNYLYSGCEVMTLWYLVEQANHLYGVPSKYKLRCQTFTPSRGSEIYPVFDDATGDLVALSVMTESTARTAMNTTKRARILDAYTADWHVRYRQDGEGAWYEDNREEILSGKIPAVYIWRESPVWEDTINAVYEMEWTLSRNANYLRKNSRPLLMVKAGTVIDYGDEPSELKASRSVFQTPNDGDMRYITWSQPIEPLKFQIDTLRQEFFTLLQLPDLSYSNLRNNVISGEAMKQMLTDAALKVGDESGAWVEFLTREISVIKSFLPFILGEEYRAAIDAVGVDISLNAYTKADEGEDLRNIATAVQNKLISRREGIGKLGWSTDIDATERAIIDESQADAMEPSF